MIDDDDDRPLPALGSAARPQLAVRQMCPAGGRPINPQTGECACCSD